MTDAIGFIGVGTIAAATVHGLRARWPDLRIHLSPRSAETSRALAASDPLISREDSNADVVAASRTVVLSMLPAQLDDVVRELRFRPDQIVVSCVAGAPLSHVEALVAPARACRLVPLPMIARHEGPILLHPALPETRRLFNGLGDLIEPGSEEVFRAFATGSAMMSSLLALQAAAAGWIVERGGSQEEAATYVASLFRAVAETAVRTRPAERSGLISGHETPGGMNERVRSTLEQDGWFGRLGRAFDHVLKLRRQDLQR